METAKYAYAVLRRFGAKVMSFLYLYMTWDCLRCCLLWDSKAVSVHFVAKKTVFTVWSYLHQSTGSLNKLATVIVLSVFKHLVNCCNMVWSTAAIRYGQLLQYGMVNCCNTVWSTVAIR